MGVATKIEWTDATWNPWQGCTKVSPACTNCYMFSDMKRYGRSPTDVRRSAPPTFNLPLRKNRAGEFVIPSGANVFTCSWSDWFHEAADEWRNDAWEIIRQRPDVTFQIVTKRTDRILNCLPDDWGDGWPNVWLIATVENQHWADIRIPQLLRVPSVIRGLSMEPLLGPIDLRGWGDHAPSADAWKSYPVSWSDFQWPDWVPTEQRKHIESFWGPENHRCPRDWGRSHIAQHVPATGARLTCERSSVGGRWANISKTPYAPDAPLVTGRYLHRWNNIGVLVQDDGSVVYASGGSGSGWLSRWRCDDGEYRHKINWIIVGGESGPGARPMYPDWVRSIRDQCKSRSPVAPFEDDVSFFFKQWGDWIPDGQENTAPEGFSAEIAFPEHLGETHLSLRVGKKYAGRILDGREWSEFPRASVTGLHRKVARYGQEIK